MPAEPVPTVTVVPAPPVRMRGAASPAPDEPGDVDCNSPAHWDGEALYLINSAGHPWLLAGDAPDRMEALYRRVEFDNEVSGARWIESTWRAPDGRLYGWYHNEPLGVCPGRADRHLTAPRIGAVRSDDLGATWHDLGFVLAAPPNTDRCDTANYYFAGGIGDFCVIPDRAADYLYFLTSTYAPADQQGVAIARMAVPDRDAPTGRVWKWRDGRWNDPGLGGDVTPIYAAAVDWHRADADALWGPSVHWNTHVERYVMLLNRAVDGDWTQEGVYASFCADLAVPTGWSEPRRILARPEIDAGPAGAFAWYPQVLGETKPETDTLAGGEPRLFVRGQSRWRLRFGFAAGGS